MTQAPVPLDSSTGHDGRVERFTRGCYHRLYLQGAPGRAFVQRGPGFMAALQSPFIRKTVKCPACHHPYGQRYFRKGLFVAGKEEPDHFVAEFQWLNDKTEQVHPPYYFVCYCPKCFYSDTIEDFSDPWRTDFGPYVVKYFRRILKSGDPFKDALGARVDYEHMDFQSALHLHLLALYAQMLPPPDLQDAYKIARLYLRVAWLYRESPLGEAPPRSAAPPVLPKAPPRPVESAPSMVEPLLEHIDRVDGGLRGIGADLTALRALVDKSFGDNSLGEDAGQERALGPLGHHLAGLLADAERTAATMRQLTESIAKAKAPAAEEPPTPGEPLDEGLPAESLAPLKPLNPAEHRAWLEQMQGQWPPLPLTEAQAARTAIRWFQQSIEKDSRLDSHESFTAAGTIIAHLQTRLEDFGAALDMVNAMHRSALETRMKCMERLRSERDLSEADKKRIEARLTRVGVNIDDLVDAREDLISKLYERDKARILEILTSTKGRPVKEREQALLAGGIRNELITRLKRKGGPLGPAK